MPSLPDANTIDPGTVTIYSYCRSTRLLRISRVPHPPPRQNLIRFTFLLITEENQTRYVMTQTMTDFDYTTIRFERLSSTGVPIAPCIEYDIDAIIRTQSQTNREDESTGGDM